MSTLKLIEAAAQARACAYVPYSKFSVGAALFVENISLGPTICAERAAVAAAIAGGQKDFVAIAVVTDSHEPAVPCGGCRQVLAEFNPSIKIITSTIGGTSQEFSLSDLLPRPKQGILE